VLTKVGLPPTKKNFKFQFNVLVLRKHIVVMKASGALIIVLFFLLIQGCIGSFNEGERLFRSGKFEESIQEFSKVLFVKVTDINTLHLRARAYEELGEWQKAEDDYRSILKLDPKHAQAYAGLGKINWENKRFREAENFYLLAANNDPTNFDILFQLGQALLKNKKYETADEFLQLAKEIDDKNPLVYFYQGMARSQIGDLLGAAGSFNMCLKYDPDNLVALYNRGLVRMTIGFLSWALEDFEKVLENKPNHVEALARRGATKILLNDPSGCTDISQAAAKGSAFAQIQLENC
jgi:tetratricopeptide (TPR) repeat protein